MTVGQHGPLLTFDQAKRQARTILADAMRGYQPVALHGALCGLSGQGQHHGQETMGVLEMTEQIAQPPCW